MKKSSGCPISRSPRSPPSRGAAGGGAAADGDQLVRGEELGLAGTLWRLAAEGAAAAVLRFLPAVSRPVSAVSAPPPEAPPPPLRWGRCLRCRSLPAAVVPSRDVPPTPQPHPQSPDLWATAGRPSTRDPRRMWSTGWTAERRGREGWLTRSVAGHGSCGGE